MSCAAFNSMCLPRWMDLNMPCAGNASGRVERRGSASPHSYVSVAVHRAAAVKWLLQFPFQTPTVWVEGGGGISDHWIIFPIARRLDRIVEMSSVPKWALFMSY